MNLATVLLRTPDHQTIGGRFHANGRGRVDELPEYLFVEGAAMRARGEKWATIAQWIQSEGVSISESTVRNKWSEYIRRTSGNE